MRKKVRAILACVLISAIITYLAMLLDTNQLVSEVNEIMHGTVDRSVTEGMPLARYNRSNYLENAVVDVRLIRGLVLHNFSDGYMWVYYTTITIKNDIPNIGSSSYRIWSLWKIHKEDGKWTVVHIDEGM